MIAAVASAFLGEKVDAGNHRRHCSAERGIDLSQTYRSQRAVEQLRKQVAPTATVLRGGEWKEIQRRDVVPGDIVRLSAGRSGSRGRAPPDCARSLCAASLVNGRIDARRKGSDRRARLDQSGCAQYGLSGHIRRERNGDGGGRPDRRSDSLWRHRDSPRGKARKRQPSIRACEISANSSRERSSFSFFS